MHAPRPFFTSSHPTRAPRYKTPEFGVGRDCRPYFLLIDEMGNTHRLQDGCTISWARFVGYDLAGVLLHNVTLEVVAFAACDLSNFELQSSTLDRILVSGCAGGPVFNRSRVSHMKVEGTTSETAIVRWFGCQISALLITNNICGIEFSFCTGDDIRIEHSRFVRQVLVRHCQLRRIQIVSCVIEKSYFVRSSLLQSEIFDTHFIRGDWSDIDLSLGMIHKTTLEDLRIRNVRLDLTAIKRLRLESVRAVQISAWWAEWTNVEFVGGMAGISLHHCTVRSLMLHGTKVWLSMTDSRTYGMRLCDVEGYIRGTDTIWWRPVLRRNMLRGDGKRGIVVIEPDCSNTKVVGEFALRLNDSDALSEDDEIPRNKGDKP